MTLTDWIPVVAASLVIVIVAVWSVSSAAARIDRLHRKITAARSALDAQLVRRSSAAVELAGSALLDPASSFILADRALSALGVSGNDSLNLSNPGGLAGPGLAADERTHLRESAESELSRTMRHILADSQALSDYMADPIAAQMLGSLRQSWYRVTLARLFYNDAIGQALRLRRRRLVRILHLAGHAAVPEMFDMDDELPAEWTSPTDAASVGDGTAIQPPQR